MSNQGRVIVHRSIKTQIEENVNLCYQLVTYSNDVDGYRFMHEINGKMRSAMGQACIPNPDIAIELIQTAKQEGWGSFNLQGGKRLKITNRTVNDISI